MTHIPHPERLRPGDAAHVDEVAKLAAAVMAPAPRHALVSYLDAYGVILEALLAAGRPKLSPGVVERCIKALGYSVHRRRAGSRRERVVNGVRFRDPAFVAQVLAYRQQRFRDADLTTRIRREAGHRPASQPGSRRR
ncbi:hypothetical protein [Streptomyces chilikensis]|uniref:hypothetical protein n=1 Tax=Streptomyces chilikensis TaxID=1194079 RepID=UPI00140C299A|nr:hypothetical protein [Streptomyces chilikensis]